MSRKDRVTLYGCGAILLACLFMTMIRNETWRSETLLWKDVIHKSPDSPIGYFGLAREYHKSGNGQLAFDNYQMAMGLAGMKTDFRSRDILAHTQANMGQLLIRTGNAEDRKLGIMALQASLSLFPYYGPAVLSLSQALNDDGRYSESITMVDEAMAHGFGSAFTEAGWLIMNKGIALCALGFQQQANEQFDYAASHFPDIDPAECRATEGF